LLNALQGCSHNLVNGAIGVSRRDKQQAVGATRVGDLFDVRLGGVTGDAQYFLLTDLQRCEFRLPERTCTPVLSKASQLTAALVTKSIWLNLRKSGGRCWLFSPRPEHLQLKSVKRYLALPANKGGCERTGFKVSIRDPWYEVPLPDKIDGFLSGMTKRAPWIAWRGMRGLSATNTLYVITCKERLSRPERCAWSISLLTSPARKVAKHLGRHYADGLVKYEPCDLKNILLPRPISTRNSEENYRKVVALLLRGEEKQAEREANKLCK